MSDSTNVQIPIQKIQLEGDLSIPNGAKGIVIFAHGSGSGRFSPRNQYVAKALQEKKLATLLIDLLTHEEETIDEQTKEIRFNIHLLADRLEGVTDWLVKNPETKKLKIGYFGASTGAAAAIIAAAKKEGTVYSVVSRGGRPDLAKAYLAHIQSPTLLIVGGYDSVVIDLNKEAFDLLACEKKMEIVPGATHLFEEPGALAKVAALAGDWFSKYLD